MKQLFKKNWEMAVILTLFVILVIACFPLISARLTENVGFSVNYTSDSRALSDRVFYNNVSRETISNNFIAGSGPGTFIFQINEYLKSTNYSSLATPRFFGEKGEGCVKNNISQNLEHWEYQPVHNIYLLIISEIGIVGFAIFCLIITEILSNSIRIIRKTAKTKSF